MQPVITNANEKNQGKIVPILYFVCIDYFY